MAKMSKILVVVVVVATIIVDYTRAGAETKKQPAPLTVSLTVDRSRYSYSEDLFENGLQFTVALKNTSSNTVKISAIQTCNLTVTELLLNGKVMNGEAIPGKIPRTPDAGVREDVTGVFANLNRRRDAALLVLKPGKAFTFHLTSLGNLDCGTGTLVHFVPKRGTYRFRVGYQYDRQKDDLTIFRDRVISNVGEFTVE
jgi:hypothetical protein